MVETYDAAQLEQAITDYLSGNCITEEREHLFGVLNSDIEAATLFRKLSAVHAIASVPAFAQEETKQLIKIKSQISLETSASSRRLGRIPIWLKIASITILLLASNYFWYMHTEDLVQTYTNEKACYEIKVPAGSRTSIVLPDGTEVSLNAGSVLRYHHGFGIRDRQVRLDGEGYFKVAKNREIPFYVETNEIRVEVVGTVFNVRAYNDDDYVTVDLMEGRVNLLATQTGYAMKLYPNEQAVYERSTGFIKKSAADVAKSCGWLEGGLSFENEAFADIARGLERKYQVKIVIRSERLKNERFSGSFNNDQSINEILDEINVEKRYTWFINGDTILVNDIKKEVVTRK